MTDTLFMQEPFEMLAHLRDGMTGVIGSFSSRIDPPSVLLDALANSQLKDLTFVVLAISNDEDPLGTMAKNGMLRKIITGFNNSNKYIEILRKKGEIEVEFVPYGPLVERIRLAAGGIPSFCSPVGVGTVYERGREIRTLEGRRYIVEPTIRPDFALIRGWQADRRGNIRYWPSATHLNSYAAAASKLAFAQVDEVVESMDAENVGTSFVYLNGIVKA
ncbi:CoA transferase subunit A [Burkholderia cepacia]|uniref:CoA transferase subunit A n=1 Tax=Burkholderia cepacia TaxID=292 RepID=UPI001CF46687|nr:3-oxoacid CoA-transferase subunit A [Burkholderia cepacia]MCA8350737.1 3-oxoacid CoA-transferase subunit A [Burkholderia cepacia]